MNIFVGICTFVFIIGAITTDSNNTFRILAYVIAASFGLCYLFGFIQL